MNSLGVVSELYLVGEYYISRCESAANYFDCPKCNRGMALFYIKERSRDACQLSSICCNYLRSSSSDNKFFQKVTFSSLILPISLVYE